jgi:uncharacterized protein (TIGR03067 family)
VFSGTDLTVSRAGQDVKAAIKVDPTKTPKHLDLTALDGEEKGATAACSYKLDGDRLTLCIPYFSQDRTVRPKEFKAGADGGIMLLVLERRKEEVELPTCRPLSPDQAAPVTEHSAF